MTILRMKELRQKLYFSQEQMAACLHISRQAYGLYERGLREPPYDILIRFASLTQVSMDYLLGLSEEKICLNPKEQQLIRLFRALDNTGQESIVRQLQYEYCLCRRFSSQDTENSFLYKQDPDFSLHDPDFSLHEMI
ncbi:MAG: helix-turn-helix transcriptional regulator [Clostridiales bacterium]|nr:helix-turn-helix transcriptional regulator [Clostridiales bacterium]